jgi:hypothetical protein
MTEANTFDELLISMGLRRISLGNETLTSQLLSQFDPYIQPALKTVKVLNETQIQYDLGPINTAHEPTIAIHVTQNVLSIDDIIDKKLSWKDARTKTSEAEALLQLSLFRTDYNQSVTDSVISDFNKAVQDINADFSGYDLETINDTFVENNVSFDPTNVTGITDKEDPRNVKVASEFYSSVLPEVEFVVLATRELESMRDNLHSIRSATFRINHINMTQLRGRLNDVKAEMDVFYGTVQNLTSVNIKGVGPSLYNFTSNIVQISNDLWDNIMNVFQDTFEGNVNSRLRKLPGFGECNDIAENILYNTDTFCIHVGLYMNVLWVCFFLLGLFCLFWVILIFKARKIYRLGEEVNVFFLHLWNT